MSERPAPGDTIRLKPTEIFMAAMVGIMRQCQNLKRRRQQAHGHDPRRDWQDHINGCGGEMAVARRTNIYWSGNLGRLRAKDVGFLQVRTRSKEDYDLIVHPHDSDEDPFIHVWGLNGVYRLMGWCYGNEAKQETYWGDPAGGRPAYFVPANQLRPMASLYELLGIR